MKSISRAILKAKNELPDDCAVIIRISKDNIAVELEAHEDTLFAEPFFMFVLSFLASKP